MANVAKDEVSLVAGGKSYTLCFSLNAIIEIQEAAGEDINAVLVRVISAEPDYPTMRLLLWGLLVDHHPEITVKEAGRIVPDGGLATLGAKLGEAVRRAIPAGSTEGNPQQASPDGTGRSS